MALTGSVSAKCHECIRMLKDVISRLSDVDQTEQQLRPQHVTDELDRFSLWIGNIGALHQEASPLSLESRLQQEEEVLAHINRLLEDFAEVAGELLDVVTGACDRDKAYRTGSDDDNDEEAKDEPSKLVEEVADCTRRLFRMSRLIRQAAPTDLFIKALSRDRYRFNDQFDISYVGEKYSKLAAEDLSWLRTRLGRAITQRRHYLSYIRDHRDKLEFPEPDPAVPAKTELPQTHAPLAPIRDSSSQPSTFLTKASSIQPGYISPKVIAQEEVSDHEDDAKSYTTISRSEEGGIDDPLIGRIPKLSELHQGAKGAVECQFCFRMKRFENEKRWKKHVFSDLRTYVCTAKDCEGPYFDDINDWFRHEMENHYVNFTCAICPGNTYRCKDRYLSHVRKSHPALLSTGDVRLVLDVARQPMKEIPVENCPCCVEWKDRVRQRATIITADPDSVICVTPTVFKRHLASHLEALSLFAIPVSLSNDQDARSNIAIEDETTQSSYGSDLSILTFNSQPQVSDADFYHVDVHKAKLGADHPDRLTSIANLALTYREQGQWKDAEKLEVQVLETRQAMLGPSHPDTLISMANLAHTYWGQDRLSEAVYLMRRCVEAQEVKLGISHPHYQTNNAVLAQWVSELDKEREQPSTLALDDVTDSIAILLPNNVSKAVTYAFRAGETSYISPDILKRCSLPAQQNESKVLIDLRWTVEEDNRGRSYRVLYCLFEVRDDLETDLAIGSQVLEQLKKQAGSTEDRWDPDESTTDEALGNGQSRSISRHAETSSQAGSSTRSSGGPLNSKVFLETYNRVLDLDDSERNEDPSAHSNRRIDRDDLQPKSPERPSRSRRR